jgi:hypothetical protein
LEIFGRGCVIEHTNLDCFTQKHIAASFPARCNAHSALFHTHDMHLDLQLQNPQVETHDLRGYAAHVSRAGSTTGVTSRDRQLGIRAAAGDPQPTVNPHFVAIIIG